MEPHAFVAEVYRRMQVRSHPRTGEQISPDVFLNNPLAVSAAEQYRGILPKDKDARILDIGFGNGWFLAACIHLGYTNIYGADFGAGERFSPVSRAIPSLKAIYEIENNIGDFLIERDEKWDFIHLSHVIEHIPKYSLLFITDALYKSLVEGGVLFLRTPNMESPCALSSLFVTLAHEYGFAGSNLKSLLDICGFDDITFLTLPRPGLNWKTRLGIFLRKPFLAYNRIKHRLFGVNRGGVFGQELVVSARRGDFPGFFDERYR